MLFVNVHVCLMVSGQKFDGQKVDGQKVDGQKVDGQKVDGQKLEICSGDKRSICLRIIKLFFLPDIYKIIIQAFT